MSDDLGLVDEEAVQAFIEKWSLQSDAQQVLAGMDGAMQQRVMSEFNPRDTSRDVNPIFHKFTSSMTAGVPRVGQQASGAQTAEFVQRWALGPEAEVLLRGLPPHIQHRAMQEFRPRDASRDANGIFIKFCSGIAQQKPRTGKGGGKGFMDVILPGQQGGFQSPMMAYQPVNFHQQAYQQAQNPYVSGSAEPVDEIVLEDFVMKWSLSAEAQAALQGLDPAMQNKVISEFAPRDASRDCNPLFHKFVQGLAAKGKGKGKPAGFRAPYPYNASPAPMARGGGGGAGGSATAAAFVAQWNLNQDAQNMMFGFPAEVQLKVMSQFSPRDTSTDVSNIFMKFASNCARGQGHGAARYTPY
jgi:hypothetical protein